MPKIIIDGKDFEVEEKYLPPTFSPVMNTDIKIPQTSFKRSEVIDPGENRTFAIFSIISQSHVVPSLHGVHCPQLSCL